VKAGFLPQVSMLEGSFETDPYILQQKMRQVLLKVPFFHPNAQRGTPEVDALLNERMLLLSSHCGEEEAELTLDYALDVARVAILRHNVRLVIFDPWNEIEHQRLPGENDHDYTGRAIRKIKRFCRRHNVAFWMVAHPRKPDEVGKDQSKAPGLYSISGSAHWANKADYGITIHRPDKSEPITYFTVTKVRMGLPGKEGTEQFTYNEHTGGYEVEAWSGE
jgi:twinkle protein